MHRKPLETKSHPRFRPWIKAILGGFLIAFGTQVEATTRTWIGAGINALASTAENWSDNTPPVAGDVVVLDNTHLGNAQTNVTWDINPGETGFTAWNQTANYDGTVTILTKFPGEGTFTNLHVSGSIDLQGGVWTHPANAGTGVGHNVDRLAVTVNGDFTLGGGAVINLGHRGYTAATSPSPGATGTGGPGSSHGGSGQPTVAGAPRRPTYGSIIRSEDHGSGGMWRGGGALKLTSSGTVQIDGVIHTDSPNDGPFANRTAGAGGSILIHAAAVTGVGTIRVSGGSPSNWSCGGGRIALVGTNALVEPTGLTLQAFPGSSRQGESARGRAGTIFLETAGTRRLIIDQNQHGVHINDLFTALLPELGPHDPSPATRDGVLAGVVLDARRGAFVGMTSDLRMKDFFLRDGSRLYLNGYTLYLGTAYHVDWGQAEWVTYSGGSIVWAVPSTLIVY